MRILLICAQGMSTSLLVNNMKAYASSSDVIEAHPISQLKDIVNEFDVVLVGPQVSYKYAEVKKVCDVKNIPSALIDMKVYGRMDGKSAYDQAKKIVKI